MMQSPPAVVNLNEADLREQKSGLAQASGKENGSVGVDSILWKLPTPARSRTTSKTPKDEPLAAAIRPASSRGPEPWGLQDASGPQQNNNYRELLQFRGQQAMQRSQMRQTVPAIPPPARAAKLPPIMEGDAHTGSVDSTASTSRPNAWPNNQGQIVWYATTGEPQMQQLQPPSSTMQGHHIAQQFQQHWFEPAGINGMGVVQASTPATTMMMPVGSSRLPDASMRPVLTATAACSSGQHTPCGASCSGSPCSAQELMTTLVGSGAFGLDEQQIAEALRAAAPCVYDD